jgi:hypothetical protein
MDSFTVCAYFILQAKVISCIWYTARIPIHHFYMTKKKHMNKQIHISLNMTVSLLDNTVCV